ncbi:MAG: PLP-dependent aminotransferase family protein [Sporolactobacillus sp.]
MDLNRKSGMPLYIQVVDYIKEKIRAGEWGVGTKLPSQRKLAKFFHVNRSTVTIAFDELTAQGLIRGAHGAGTEIINNTWGLLAKNQPTNWRSYIEAGSYKPNLSVIQKINQAEFFPHIIRMGTGELSPDLMPQKRVWKILNKQPDPFFSLGYQEPKGELQLREEVSKYVSRFGIKAGPSSIMIVSGALQALQLISVGLLEHGSTLLLERPSYLYSINVFQSSGMRFVGLPMDSEGMKIERLEEYRRIYKSSIVYTIPNFHNPTGTLMSSKRRRQLLSISEQERIPILEDDVYHDLWLDNPPPAPLKALDQAGQVIYIGSLSKALSPGLRIGWIIGPDSVIDRLADIKMQSDYGSSSLAQWMAKELLRTGSYEEHAILVRQHLKIRRDYLIDRLIKYFSDIASWRVPIGGFYIWLKLIPEIRPNALFEEALKNHILINLGVIYDRQARQCLRLSYSYATPKEMDQALRILRSLIIDFNN